MSILGGHSERRLVIVVHLVDVFVEAFVMGQSVHPVVPGVLDDGAEEHTNSNVIPTGTHKQQCHTYRNTQTVMPYLREHTNSNVIPTGTHKQQCHTYRNTQTAMSYLQEHTNSNVIPRYRNTRTAMSYLRNRHE